MTRVTETILSAYKRLKHFVFVTTTNSWFLINAICIRNVEGIRDSCYLRPPSMFLFQAYSTTEALSCSPILQFDRYWKCVILVLQYANPHFLISSFPVLIRKSPSLVLLYWKVIIKQGYNVLQLSGNTQVLQNRGCEFEKLLWRFYKTLCE